MKLDKRYERNRIFSREQQEELSEKKAAVIGCGGLGGYLIEYMVRLGVGTVTAVDGMRAETIEIKKDRPKNDNEAE